MKLSSVLESLLFVLGESVTIARLSHITGKPENEVKEALGELENNLKGRGICLLLKEDVVGLVSAPENAGTVEKVIKEEISSELTKASLETLAIVVYKGPVSRMEIDYIRGVNSSFILRNLMMRGLVERNLNPQDARIFIYRPSSDLYKMLGITKIEDLPQWTEFKERTEDFLSRFINEDEQ